MGTKRRVVITIILSLTMVFSSSVFAVFAETEQDQNSSSEPAVTEQAPDAAVAEESSVEDNAVAAQAQEQGDASKVVTVKENTGRYGFGNDSKSANVDSPSSEHPGWSYTCEGDHEGTLTLYGNTAQSGEVYDYIWFEGFNLTIQLDGALIINTNTTGGVYGNNGNLTIDGPGQLKIINTSNHDDGINVSNGNVTLNSGTLDLTAGDDGIQGDNVDILDGSIITNTGYGLFAYEDRVSISGGSVSINSSNDGILAKNTIISGGGVSINSSSDGIDAAYDVSISGGSVSIDSHEQGIEAYNVNISGGSVSIKESESGIYCGGNSVPIGPGSSDTGFSDAKVVISGGSVSINSEYCGIEANETIIRGGEVKVKGNNVGIFAGSSAVHVPDHIGLEEDTSDEVSQNITISNAKVYAEAGMCGMEAMGDIDISGKSRVESKVTGQTSDTQNQDPIAILGINGLKKSDNLTIVKPENGIIEQKVANVSAERVQNYYTVTENGAISKHVIIEETAPAVNPSGTLIATLKTSGKKGIKVSWTKMNNVAGYDIFMSRCNTKKAKHTPKLVKTIGGNNTFSWTKKSLKKKVPYKVYVKAYIMVDGNKQYVAKSPTVHCFTSGGNKKYTNAKGVKVKKSSVSLKHGKSSKIKASVKKQLKGKKLINGNHTPSLRYFSTNKSVAKVSSKGKIKAVGNGSCNVYVIATNGSYKKVKVQVK